MLLFHLLMYIVYRFLYMGILLLTVKSNDRRKPLCYAKLPKTVEKIRQPKIICLQMVY